MSIRRKIYGFSVSCADESVGLSKRLVYVMVMGFVAALRFGRNGWPVLVLSFFLIACSGIQNETTTLEEQAQQIDKQLVCPVCPGETIDQSQVELARQMRNEIREKLEIGWNEQQILQYFSASERYGEGVLSSPPKSGFGLIAWVVPPAVVMLGLVLLIVTVFRLQGKRRPVVGDGQELPSAQLASYLAMVDQELNAEHSLKLTDPETSNSNENSDTT